MTKKLFGYKVADGEDFVTTYTTKGFVLAEDINEAMVLFDFAADKGFGVIFEATNDQLEEYMEGLREAVREADAARQALRELHALEQLID